MFKGIGEFANDAPEIITGDNYEGKAGTLFDLTLRCKINIFNISKINSEVRGGKSPRIKRLSEYIGDSYFNYLAELPDLVLIMDESHRYRASAGVRAINELKPVIGLELTATPFVETARGAVPFQNVIYDYPLGKAMANGFVKEPAVVITDQEKRVIRRLGIVGLAGTMAVDFGILPYTHEEVIAAVAAVRDMWFSSTNVLSDAARAVRNLKEFLEENLDRRIQDYGRGAKVIHDRVAYRTRLEGQDLFLFTRKELIHACGETNTNEICRFLIEHDLLHQNSKPRFQSKFISINEIMMDDDEETVGKDSRVNFYSVKASILNFEFERKRKEPAALPKPTSVTNPPSTTNPSGKGKKQKW